MKQILDPVEARSGVISGRVLLVLCASSVGAVVALGLVWLYMYGGY